MASWRRDFASGFIVLGPIVVTLYALHIVYGILTGVAPEFILGAQTFEPFLPGETFAGTRERLAQLVQVTTTLAVFLTVTFLIGYLMRTTAGELLERAIDDIANHVPGVRVVYNASKMATETAFSGQDSLQKPVKIETWEGLRMTAFKTGRSAEDGRELLFVPTSPNITSGFLVEVESDRITELDESVEDALTRVLSAGFGDADRNSGMDAGVSIDVVEEPMGKKMETNTTD